MMDPLLSVFVIFILVICRTFHPKMTLDPKSHKIMCLLLPFTQLSILHHHSVIIKVRTLADIRHFSFWDRVSLYIWNWFEIPFLTHDSKCWMVPASAPHPAMLTTYLQTLCKCHELSTDTFLPLVQLPALPLGQFLCLPWLSSYSCEKHWALISRNVSQVASGWCFSLFKFKSCIFRNSTEVLCAPVRASISGGTQCGSRALLDRVWSVLDHSESLAKEAICRFSY